MISAIAKQKWKERYNQECEYIIKKYTEINNSQPVTVRYVDEEEMNEYFSDLNKSNCHKLKLKEN